MLMDEMVMVVSRWLGRVAALAHSSVAGAQPGTQA